MTKNSTWKKIRETKQRNFLWVLFNFIKLSNLLWSKFPRIRTTISVMYKMEQLTTSIGFKNSCSKIFRSSVEIVKGKKVKKKTRIKPNLNLKWLMKARWFIHVKISKISRPLKWFKVAKPRPKTPNNNHSKKSKVKMTKKLVEPSKI